MKRPCPENVSDSSPSIVELASYNRYFSLREVRYAPIVHSDISTLSDMKGISHKIQGISCDGKLISHSPFLPIVNTDGLSHDDSLAREYIGLNRHDHKCQSAYCVIRVISALVMAALFYCGIYELLVWLSDKRIGLSKARIPNGQDRYDE